MKSPSNPPDEGHSHFMDTDERYARFMETADKIQGRLADMWKFTERLPERRAAEARIEAARASGQNERANTMYIDYLAEFFPVSALQMLLDNAQNEGDMAQVERCRAALAKVRH
ncbi:MAG: hypothetical protein AAF292_11090 [Pseudomonadota bacterium]